MAKSPEKLGASYFQNPHSLHAQLREEGPVVRVEMPEGFTAWLVTRYADVRAALADQRLCKDWRKLAAHYAASAAGDPAGEPAEASPENMLSVHMLNMDPPDHERLRRLVTKASAAASKGCGHVSRRSPARCSTTSPRTTGTQSTCWSHSRSRSRSP